MLILRRQSPQALYPETYVWLLLLSTMDVLLTCVVIACGGAEANGVANWIVGHFDLMGLALFKLALFTFFVAICEIIGRRNRAVGLRLTVTAIAINIIPVALAFALLYRHFFIPPI